MAHDKSYLHSTSMSGPGRTHLHQRFTGFRLASRERRRRFVLLLLLSGAAITATAAEFAFHWFAPAPRVEPDFNRAVLGPQGQVKDFELRDLDDVLHTRAEWAGRPAIVLFLIESADADSIEGRTELVKLVRTFEPSGVLFLGVVTPSDASGAPASAHANRSRFPFPLLIDSRRGVQRQMGVESAQTAVVLSDDGQILYHGSIARLERLGDRSGDDRALSSLEAALEAVVSNEMPPLTFAGRIHSRLAAEPGPESDLANDEITFNKHIAPILWQNCTRCHRPGEIGPFSLLTYRDAAKRAGFLHEVMASGKMPPWKPRAGAGVFLDAARLSANEIEMVRRWVDCGCKPGDPADLPGPPQFREGWQLGQPDLILAPTEAFTIPAAGPDIYRSYSLPMTLDRDVTIKGVEFRPGNRRVTHHSRMYLDVTGDARRRDRDDPAPGFTGWFGSDGRFELPYPGLGAWTPGMTARFGPEGVGRLIGKGSDVVLQVHYHPSGRVETDRSSVGLYFATKPTTKTMAGYTLCTDRIDIPPGEKRHKVILSTRIKADIHLYTVVPHAHHLCREFRLAATLPDGTVEPLLWITHWDMDWQDQYRYVKPVRLPEGTVLTLAAYFDNSADNPRNPNSPPRRVRYGVETKDEMCACHLEFLCDTPAGREVYQLKSPFGL
jgi:peroxiredoxin